MIREYERAAGQSGGHQPRATDRTWSQRVPLTRGTSECWLVVEPDRHSRRHPPSRPIRSRDSEPAVTDTRVGKTERARPAGLADGFGLGVALPPRRLIAPCADSSQKPGSPAPPSTGGLGTPYRVRSSPSPHVERSLRHRGGCVNLDRPLAHRPPASTRRERACRRGCPRGWRTPVWVGAIVAGPASGWVHCPGQSGSVVIKSSPGSGAFAAMSSPCQVPSGHVPGVAYAVHCCTTRDAPRESVRS